jgi:hypothetical protein
VASYRFTSEYLGLPERSFGLSSPFVQRFGISPYLDGVDSLGIHRVGGDGDVNAPVELTAARDEVTEGIDVLGPILGTHEFAAGNDNHVFPQDRRPSMFERSLWKREPTWRLGVPKLLEDATAADPRHIHA